MINQIIELKAQIVFDRAQLLNLETQTAGRQVPEKSIIKLQKRVIQSAIRSKESLIKTLENSMTVEIFRYQRNLQFAPAETKPLSVGALDLIDEWELKR